MSSSEEYVANSKARKIDICPHLGLEHDPSTFCAEVSPKHRCYLWMQRDRIDLSHQARFCLTEAHTGCPWLSISTPVRTKLDSRAAALRQAAAEKAGPASRRGIAFAAAFWVLLRTTLVRLALLVWALAVAFWRWFRLNAVRAARLLWALAVRGSRKLGSRAHPDGATAPSGSGASPMVPAGLLSVDGGVLTAAASTGVSPEAGVQPASTAAAVEASRAESFVEQGILALRGGSREVAYALFVQASETNADSLQAWLWRAALAGSPGEKRDCLEQMLRVDPSNVSAKAALAILEKPGPARIEHEPADGAAVEAYYPTAGRPGVSARVSVRSQDRRATVTWKCSGCDVINTGPSRVCRACGRPSPEVEEELISTNDTLLAQGLEGLKAGNEELAHHYFVMASDASPESKLAWQWRAKTAPTLDEVIRCLRELLKIDPEDSKAQSDLSWALQRKKHEEAVAAPAEKQSSRPGIVAPALRRVERGARRLLLQFAGVCAFALALDLTIPYALRVTELPFGPEVNQYLSLLPSTALPSLQVQLPYLPAMDTGPWVLLFLGLLLLHAAFLLVDGGGLATRVWTALLGAGACGLMLSFGTNPPSSTYAAGLAAVAAVMALLGAVPASKKTKGWENRGAGDR